MDNSSFIYTPKNRKSESIPQVKKNFIRLEKKFRLRYKLIDLFSLYNINENLPFLIKMTKFGKFSSLLVDETEVYYVSEADTETQFKEVDFKIDPLSEQWIKFEIFEFIDKNILNHLAEIKIEITKLLKESIIIKDLVDDDLFPRGKLYIELIPNFNCSLSLDLKLNYFIRGIFKVGKKGKGIKSNFHIKYDGERVYNSEFNVLGIKSEFIPIQVIFSFNVEDAENLFFEVVLNFYEFFEETNRKNSTSIGKTMDIPMDTSMDTFLFSENINFKLETSGTGESIKLDEIKHNFKDFSLNYQINKKFFLYKDYLDLMILDNDQLYSCIVLIDLSKSVFQLYGENFLYYQLLKDFLLNFMNIFLGFLKDFIIRFILTDDVLEIKVSQFSFIGKSFKYETLIENVLDQIFFSTELGWRSHSIICDEINIVRKRLEINKNNSREYTSNFNSDPDCNLNTLLLIISDFDFVDFTKFIKTFIFDENFFSKHKLEIFNLILQKDNSIENYEELNKNIDLNLNSNILTTLQNYAKYCIDKLKKYKNINFEGKLKFNN